MPIAVRFHRTLELGDDKYYVITCGRSAFRNSRSVLTGYFISFALFWYCWTAKFVDQFSLALKFVTCLLVWGRLRHSFTVDVIMQIIWSKLSLKM